MLKKTQTKQIPYCTHIPVRVNVKSRLEASTVFLCVLRKSIFKSLFNPYPIITWSPHSPVLQQWLEKQQQQFGKGNLSSTCHFVILTQERASGIKKEASVQYRCVSNSSKVAPVSYSRARVLLNEIYRQKCVGLRLCRLFGTWTVCLSVGQLCSWLTHAQ